ncbi:MAG: PQQ-binding-like beta-propeller repeat protein, partial [Pseudomonadales bacterium]|nr:PQQ-binding-like beta-propeller repeat protein [Pseudomonadales bacterium]
MDAAGIRARVERIDGEAIMAADETPGDWIAHGRTYDEQRHSPLTQISTENVSELGLAWYADLGTTRGLESTPIVVDGVMFNSGTWSTVFAHDARTGELIWKYDPEVPKEWGVYACCDVVNRGVAAWEGKIIVGTLDGRLVALDAGTGEEVWSVQTTPEGQPYTITGAPRIVKGQVIIGNGGGEYGVRGYITAYDVDTGEEKWRFYTVPGNPDEPFEGDHLKAAASTWRGGEWWTVGGGGTVWDSMAYDAELDLLYIGVGNGSPWNRQVRSPGGGDNLYLSSIVAVDPDDGSYAWHYQTTPGDTWDYTATQHILLA